MDYLHSPFWPFLFVLCPGCTYVKIWSYKTKNKENTVLFFVIKMCFILRSSSLFGQTQDELPSKCIAGSNKYLKYSF